MIGAHVVNYDAIIEALPLDDNATTHQPGYEKWLPLGPVKSKPTEHGNYIAFKTYLVDKATKKKISGPVPVFQDGKLVPGPTKKSVYGPAIGGGNCFSQFRCKSW